MHIIWLGWVVIELLSSTACIVASIPMDSEDDHIVRQRPTDGKIELTGKHETNLHWVRNGFLWATSHEASSACDFCLLSDTEICA